MCYTHYFAVLPVLIMWGIAGLIHIIDRKFIKRMFCAGICVIIGYTPWLATFARQFNNVHDKYWIPETSIASIKAINAYILSYDVKIRLFFYVMFLTLLIYSAKTRKQYGRYTVWMLVMTFLPWLMILMSVGIARVYRSILIDRYIVPTLGIAGIGELLLLRKLLCSDKIIIRAMAMFFCIIAVRLSCFNTIECFKAEIAYGNEWNEMIADISVNEGNTFLYIENGSQLVRPLTIMFPDANHICKNANMTEYNQFLFKTKDYDNEDIDTSVFVVTASNWQADKGYENKYLGTYMTFNADKHSVYFFAEGIKGDVQ